MKILIVDDEEKIRDMYKDFLYQRMEEKTLTFSHDGMDALMQCLREKYDVILLDYKMPRLNGIDLLTVLRGGGLNKNTPVIMISGELGGTELAPELLPDTYLMPKPVNFKRLGDVMTSLRH